MIETILLIVGVIVIGGLGWLLWVVNKPDAQVDNGVDE